MERYAQATGGSGNNRGKEESDEVNHVAPARPFARAAEGRKERSATVQRTGEQICDVETTGNVGTNEGMEVGGSVSGETYVQIGFKVGKRRPCSHRSSYQLTEERGNF